MARPSTTNQRMRTVAWVAVWAVLLLLASLLGYAATLYALARCWFPTSPALALLAPLEGRIQSLGYVGTDGIEQMAEEASRLGVSRIAPLGTVAWPPSDWRHEGRFQLLPLLNWTEFETAL